MQFVVGFFLLMVLAAFLLETFGPTVATILTSLIMGALNALAGALVGLLIVPIERFLNSRPPFFAAWNDAWYSSGTLNISRRSPTLFGRFRVPCRSVATATAYGTGLVGMAAVAVGFSESHMELIKGVRAPFWLPTAIAMAVAVPVLLAAGRRLDRLVLRGGEGDAHRAFKMPEHARVQRLQAEVEAAWKRLGLQPPAAAICDIAAFVAANRADVLRDPQVVNRRLQTEAERMREQVERMTRMVDAFERVEAKIMQARVAVNRTRSASMYEMLDYLRQSQLEARALLLEQKWADFEAAMKQTEEHLQDLIATCESAEAAEPDPTATAGPQSPYRVLGVTEDMSTEAIEAVVRRLLQIYHPDRGLVQDRAPFQEIQRAWTAIKQQRGVSS